MVHLDIDPWELGKNYPAEVAILGDPKGTLPELIAAVRARMSAAQQNAGRERLKAASAETLAELEKLKAKARSMAGHSPVQALALIHAIGEILPKDTVVIDETVSSGGGLRQLVKSDDPQSFFGLRGGGIGWGIPASIGVKIALPDRPVIALVGDGSSMYTIQALWTAARHRIGAKFVICNNHRYKLLDLNIEQYYRELGLPSHPHPESFDLGHPAREFAELAWSMGVPGRRVAKVSEVDDAIRELLHHDGPYLIDLVVE
jgi:benzoylformate decarboxylase